MGCSRSSLLYTYPVPAQSEHMLGPHCLFSPVAGWTVAIPSPFTFFSFLSICFFPPVLCLSLDAFIFFSPCNFMVYFFVFGGGVSLFCCCICTRYRPKVIVLLYIHSLHWVCLLFVVLCLCCRCCSMLVLNLNEHKSCALCSIGAASSCYTVCMLDDTTGYRLKGGTYYYLCILH